MKTNWVKILLCVSLVFNALFAAGYLRARSHAHQFKGFEGRARRIAQRLELDAEQQKVFDRLLAQTMEERKKLHEEIRPMREKFLAELVNGEPDQAVIQAYLDQDLHKKRKELMIRQVGELMKVLRPEQRKKFEELIRKRWERRAGRHKCGG